MRIDWKKYALNLANVAKERSEDPHKKVGCVALGHDHRVLGCSYNGLAPGKNVDDKFWEDRDARRPYMIHAEINLLSLFKRNECKILASTLLPCTSCAQAIAAWGVKEVVYNELYDKDQKSLNIFEFYNIPVIQL